MITPQESATSVNYSPASNPNKTLNHGNFNGVHDFKYGFWSDYSPTFAALTTRARIRPQTSSSQLNRNDRMHSVFLSFFDSNYPERVTNLTRTTPVIDIRH